MNALKPNPDTGFLESTGYSGYQFDSPRKVKLLELAHKFFEETGNMPDVNSLCRAIGICQKTFDDHLKSDERFGEAWRNIRLKGKFKLEGKMFEYAQRPGGYMHMITWLRKEFPDEYNPDQRVIHSTDNSTIKALIDRSKGAIDAEIVTNPGIISTQSNQVDKSTFDSGVKNDK